MTLGRPKTPLVLTEDERATLERWASRPTGGQGLALRCQIVLACAEGLDNKVVAARLGVHQSTVVRWRARFVVRRLAGLSDEPHPGTARTVTDDDVRQAKLTTLEKVPADGTAWSTRSLARATGLSQSTVSHICRGFGVRADLAMTTEPAPDPRFREKVRGVPRGHSYGRMASRATGPPPIGCRSPRTSISTRRRLQRSAYALRNGSVIDSPWAADGTSCPPHGELGPIRHRLGWELSRRRPGLPRTPGRWR